MPTKTKRAARCNAARLRQPARPLDPVPPLRGHEAAQRLGRWLVEFLEHSQEHAPADHGAAIARHLQGGSAVCTVRLDFAPGQAPLCSLSLGMVGPAGRVNVLSSEVVDLRDGPPA